MLNHCGTVELKTERLVLRAFAEKDIEPIFTTWASDARVAKYTRWDAHKTVEETEQFVKAVLDKNSSRDYHWMIELGGKVIGEISVCYSDDELEMAGIGYTLGYDYWGKGYMTEAAKRVVKFLFCDVNYRKIIAGCDAENIGSAKVMEHIGMKREAVLRAQIKRKDGTWGDNLQYGILRQEYEV